MPSLACRRLRGSRKARIIGSFAVEGLIASDFAPLQGFVLTMAVMYVALNLIIDVLYGVIDPRVRIEA